MSEPAKPANDAEDLPIDDEIAALLEFEPVPRIYKRRRAWTGELQRMFIARLAATGSVNKACHAMGKDPGGIRRLRTAPGSESFRASWEAAEELWERRNPLPPPEPFDEKRNKRNKAGPHRGPSTGSGEGQRLNEYGEWEDEESFKRRSEEARDSISAKLLRIRRLFLHEISDCPAKRAAFEILTELPVDWDKAERMQPQADEPFRKPNMRDPAMLLAAEAGWMGEFVHGPDKKAELLEEINAWRAEQGLEPVGWEGE